MFFGPVHSPIAIKAAVAASSITARSASSTVAASTASTTTSSDGCVLVLPELNSGGRFDCKAKAGSGRDRSWTSEERTAMCVC